jgi:hypothetical protein
MSKLIIRNDDEIVVQRPELVPMLKNYNENLPELKRGRENFGKRQSQFMDNVLTVSKHTPLRNMRQCLSEIEKTQSALKEAFFKQKKQRLEIRIKERELEKDTIIIPASDDSPEMRFIKADDIELYELGQEMIALEINKLESQLEDSEVYISGAIRKLENYTTQYNNIKDKIMQDQGVSEFSEIDFEAEEERYHIMTAFSQGLNAVRSKGRIDEGNQIYLQQLGINGMAAEMEIQGLLKLEVSMLEQGQQPGNDLVLRFLNDMGNKYKGCSEAMVADRGMTVFTDSAAIEPKLIEESKDEDKSKES